MDSKVTLPNIQDIQVKSKLEEVTLPGDDEPTKVLMTTITFKYEGPAGDLDPVMNAKMAGHVVDAIFASPQTALGLDISRRHEGES